MTYLQEIQSQFKTSAQTKLDALVVLELKIAKAIDYGVETVKRGGTIYWIGNGGSAADAQHMAAELVGRYKRERKAIRSKALTANTSNLTAIGNDYGYDMVFERQLEAFARPEDLLIAISTSGNSKNIIKAVELARRVGMKVVSLTGATGGKLAEISDVLLNVPSTDTPRIQETHLLIEHIFCDCIEQSVM
jgi:D-sedoheptulose 7-phosphate isomerase